MRLASCARQVRGRLQGLRALSHAPVFVSLQQRGRDAAGQCRRPGGRPAKQWSFRGANRFGLGSTGNPGTKPHTLVASTSMPQLVSFHTKSVCSCMSSHNTMPRMLWQRTSRRMLYRESCAADFKSVSTLWALVKRLALCLAATPQAVAAAFKQRLNATAAA